MIRGKIIEKYKHTRLGVEVPIKFNAKEGLFSAEFNGQTMQNESIVSVRKALRELIEGAHQLEWVPAISVEFSDSFVNDEEAGVFLKYERFYLARKADGNWMEVNWNTPKDYFFYDARPYYPSRHYKSDFKIPYKMKGDSGTPIYVLAYTEELWATLETLRAALKKVQTRLIDILGNDAQRLQLVAKLTKGMLGTGAP